jgi:DnaJ-class molecular chaperone
MASLASRLPDHYGLLGLDADTVIPIEMAAKNKEIYRAYRAWIFTFTFKRGDMSSEVQHARASRKKLAYAYRVLRNPGKRRRYERQLLEEKVRQQRDAPRIFQCSGVDWSRVIEVPTDSNSSQDERRRQYEDDSVETDFLIRPACKRARGDTSEGIKIEGDFEQDTYLMDKKRHGCGLTRYKSATTGTTHREHHGK